MADGMDWMDVQAAADKAAGEERYARIRHVESIEQDLRREFRREVMELREEVGELVADVANRLTAVTEACDAGLKAMQRVIDARTEHLV